MVHWWKAGLTPIFFAFDASSPMDTGAGSYIFGGICVGTSNPPAHD